ncbi:hypothetical protein JTL76_33720 [Pseudomonas aeruginosa]|nr:hypothetical protein [Pseudomonas aeruginosa]
MTDQPQLMTEEIELIPHPMDAWRAALNALIACAPGDSAAIAVHLAEARQQALVFVDRTAATEGTRKLVDRLMLIGAGRLVSDRPSTEALLAAATRTNGKCLLTATEAAMRTAVHNWSAPKVQLAIRDINALSPEDMRLVIQDVLRRQSLGQQDSLVEADIGTAR